MFIHKKTPSKYFTELVNGCLGDKDQDKLLEEFDDLQLTPYLYRYFKNNNLFISHKLKQIYKRNTISNMIILDYKTFLEKKLKNENIRYLFYKGVYFIENIYVEIGDRYLGDIDLLVHPDDLHKLKNIFVKDNLVIEELINDNFFHERYILTKYKKQAINIDIHKNFFPAGKYPVNIDIFFENRVEHQLIILIIEINSEFFNDEKRILDFIMLADSKNIDWSYFYELADSIKLKRAVYITVKFINIFFKKNYPLNKLNRIDKLLLKNIIVFDNKRWNQFFLFFYNFDNFMEYSKFFYKKLRYVYYKKDLYREFKKFWIKYH